MRTKDGRTGLEEMTISRHIGDKVPPALALAGLHPALCMAVIALLAVTNAT